MLPTQQITSKQDKRYLTAISIISILIPIVVAFLLLVPQTGKLGNIDVSLLPHVNAVLNTATSLCLMLALFFIKNRNQEAHRWLMTIAFVLSCFFLVSYVVYHYQAAPTKFGDENGDGILSQAELAQIGIWRSIYLFVLITHIALAAIVVPFVLTAFYFAWTRQFARHRRVVKWAFPIWLYVAITGVLTYFMISPYYV
ncbi:MAG: DUF420 domain-containing protein [Cytophagales bacterium]|nr:DUF420 domain-containing protein [Bernardetiaceae bacterium]MDW8211068.1 DUF420 domain-containing protein [Cytophagales bacterium]